MRQHSASRLGRVLIIAAGILLAALMISPDAAKADDSSDWLNRTFTKSTEPKFKAKPSRLGGPITETPRRSSSRSKGVQVASLGGSYAPKPKPSFGPSLSGGSGKVNWVANSGCLNSSLRSIVHAIAATFGAVTVNSTCRSAAHNRRVGGATRSYHLTGDAVDFRVRGNWGGALSRLRGHWGGFTHYGGGLFHIDSGPRRTW